MLETHQKNLARRCPGSTSNVIRREANSILYEDDITNCPDGISGKFSGAWPSTDEQTVARILDGRWNRFWITYAVRAPLKMTPERRSEWIEKLSKASIMVTKGRLP